MRRALPCGVVLAFVAAAALAATAAAQTPPRDPRPVAPAAQEREADAKLRAQIAERPDDPAPRLALSRAQEDRGAAADAEATLIEAKRALPGSKPVLQAVAAFYNRAGRFDKTIEALTDLAALDPGDPAGPHLIGTYYWEKASKDFTLSRDDKRRYAEAGIAAEDQALALKPDYMEAMVYKNILLRVLANTETDAARQRTLIAEADALRNRALELQKQRLGTMPNATAAAPPPPPPPPQGDGSGMAPVRVGGNIPVPTKIKDVRPVYPPVAEAAHVQGVVILEATIGTDGHVVDAKVLRSIPLLDQAAVDAVRQWEFTATRIGGMAVPVLMTVTVNFALQ